MTKSTNFNPCNAPHYDVIEVPLNNQGDFVLFPATTYHRGFYSHKKNHNTFFIAQFFCVYKSMDNVLPKRFSPKDHVYYKRNLASSSVIGLFNDLRCYWDTYYCRVAHAPPKIYKLEDIDIARNQIVTRDQILNGQKFLLNIVLELETYIHIWRLNWCGLFARVTMGTDFKTGIKTRSSMMLLHIQ